MSSVKHFGAVGDGIADDTEAILHAVAAHDGVIRFPRGTYRITRSIEVPLAKHAPLCIQGTGGTATLCMEAEGPALRIVGNHGGTGDPGSLKPAIWEKERMPIIEQLVIEGKHPTADGIQLQETMQCILRDLNIRHCRHGIHLFKRNRNLLISNCQIYHNTGVGIYFDQLNLHQVNITHNHISYNRLGGIRIERSEVRNLQITGNDIEYNNAKSHQGLPSEPTAEIWVDTTADRASVNEVTISSNTIQATPSPNGANIRIIEPPERGQPPGLWSITGNIIGNQENNVHLSGCHGVTLSGNCIYSCEKSNVLVEQSQQINLSGNSFRRHVDRMHTGIRITDSHDCLLSGCVLHDESDTGQKSGASLLELKHCERITISSSQFTNGVPYGIDAQDCKNVLVTGSTIGDHREAMQAQGAIRFHGQNEGNRVVGNQLFGSCEGVTPS